MEVPDVYQALIGADDRMGALTTEEGLLEELADLVYQLLKLFAHRAGELRCGAPLTLEALHSNDLGRGLARPESALAALLGVPLSERFLGVQQAAVAARQLRGEAPLQSEREIVAKVLEEFGETAQHLSGDASGWLKRLSQAVGGSLAEGSDGVQLKAALETLELCARELISTRLDVASLVELVNLKILGRCEWNFRGVDGGTVKGQLKQAELRLLRAWLGRS